jgi:hypothetical protein
MQSVRLQDQRRLRKRTALEPQVTKIDYLVYQTLPESRNVSISICTIVAEIGLFRV